MNSIMKKYQSLVFQLAAYSLMIGCLPLNRSPESDTEIKGYDSGQLRELGYRLFPQFDRLSVQVGERKAVTMSIFISYDKLMAEDMGQLGSRRAPAEPQLDPWSDDQNKDYGAAAYREILAWLVDGENSFLKSPSVERTIKGPTTFATVIKGKGPALAASAPSMDWEILLYLGVAGTAEFAKAFGESMAVSNISMLNGHFYEDDAAAAESDSSAVDRRFRDWSDDDADLMQFWERHKSTIYQPAMAAFKAKASDASLSPERRLGYRVVVFNGCGSEKIETLVLDTMKSISVVDPATKAQGHAEVELVGMRGFSNYRHFPSQIHRFIKSLVEGQEDWSEVIKKFEFDDASTSTAMRQYLGRTKVGNSSPVYRGLIRSQQGSVQDIGADGEQKAQQRQIPRRN